jgi:ParB family transcriptional regulator, chromosome partitioning protein
VKFQDIDIHLIDRDPDQVRKQFDKADIQELAENIKSFGVLVAVILIVSDERYQLIDGERRLRAALLAGLKKVPAVILDAKPSQRDLLKLQLTINCMRKDLNPLEKAEAYRRLMDEQKSSVTELAAELAVSKALITRYLSHLTLPEEAKSLLQSGELSSSAAYALSRLSVEDQKAALSKGVALPSRDELQALASESGPKPKTAKSRCVMFNMPEGVVSIRSNDAIGVEGLISLLSELLKLSRKAKIEKLDIRTFAMMLRDKDRSRDAQQEVSHGTV